MTKILYIMFVIVSVVIAILSAVVVVFIACLTAVEEKDYMDLLEGDMWVNEMGELVAIGKIRATA